MKSEGDKDAIMDMVIGMIVVNSIPTFAPTAFINLVVFLKECTMNQFAWAKNEDFTTGRVPILGINLDLLYWFGFDRNIEDYYEIMREFSKTYL